MDKKNIYLTDDEYIDLLQRVRDKIAEDGATLFFNEDCDDIGNKSTTSNYGLCNDEFTTKEIAMWPNNFHSNKEMKYLENWHFCPFDKRLHDLILHSKTDVNYMNGCFYTCRIADVCKEFSTERVLQWFDEALAWARSGKTKKMYNQITEAMR